MNYSDVTDTERYYGQFDPYMQKYCGDCRFSEAQLVIIRYGIECSVDVSIYSNPEIPAKIMALILQQLRSGYKEYIIRSVSPDGVLHSSTITANTKQEALVLFYAGDYSKDNVIEIKDPPLSDEEVIL